MSTATAPEISAIICTYNPRPNLLRMVLDSLRRQTLPRHRFEVVIVDNNSNPPLQPADWDPDGSLGLRIVREQRQGKVFAYHCANTTARADLICMIDDDNVLDPDYLERAVAIAGAHPSIGAFAGITRGKFEWPVAEWKRPLMVYLGVRDFGPEPITSGEDRWGEWEPIGAGMVIRRDVGLRFNQILDTVPEAQKLDRSGKTGLLSGGDGLLARSAYRLGYECSYQPALKLDHHIKGPRVTTRYLMKMLYGSGRSQVLLQRTLGYPSEPLPWREVFRRLKFRFKTSGRHGLVLWCWDCGYRREAAEAARLAPPAPAPAVALPATQPLASVPPRRYQDQQQQRATA